MPTNLARNSYIRIYEVNKGSNHRPSTIKNFDAEAVEVENFDDSEAVVPHENAQPESNILPSDVETSIRRDILVY